MVVKIIKSFPITKGLISLLIKKVPINPTLQDFESYKKILDITKAHFTHDYKKFKNVRVTKYKKVIRPLFLNMKPIHDNYEIVQESYNENTLNKDSHYSDLMTEDDDTIIGNGINKEILLNKNSSIQYNYWDDVNELVDRLYLLHSSKKAGNTGLNNEILAIEEELKEAKIIL